MKEILLLNILFMGIKVEFNPDLALRNFSVCEKGERKAEECIPRTLEVGKSYTFLKEGQRLYWLEGEFPLRETQGNQNLSRPVASIIIKEVVHFMQDEKLFTRGTYEVKKVFDLDSAPYFEGFEKV